MIFSVFVARIKFKGPSTNENSDGKKRMSRKRQNCIESVLRRRGSLRLLTQELRRVSYEINISGESLSPAPSLTNWLLNYWPTWPVIASYLEHGYSQHSIVPSTRLGAISRFGWWWLTTIIQQYLDASRKTLCSLRYIASDRRLRISLCYLGAVGNECPCISNTQHLNPWMRERSLYHWTVCSSVLLN